MTCSTTCSSVLSSVSLVSSPVSLQILHSPCCASGWVRVSGSMLNSQGGERPEQHTHIPRQSWPFAETITTTVLFCFCCCHPFSAVLPSQGCWLWCGPCSLPAQLSLLTLCYICLNEPLFGKSGERVREHNGAQNGRE